MVSHPHPKKASQIVFFSFRFINFSFHLFTFSFCFFLSFMSAYNLFSYNIRGIPITWLTICRRVLIFFLRLCTLFELVTNWVEDFIRVALGELISQRVLLNSHTHSYIYKLVYIVYTLQGIYLYVSIHILVYYHTYLVRVHTCVAESDRDKKKKKMCRKQIEKLLNLHYRFRFINTFILHIIYTP